MFSGRLWELFIDSFPKILIPGLTVTIPLTIISFTFALIIAVIMALVQFANVKVLKQIARFYIWIFRGTPLLVQLFVVFFGLSRVGVLLDPFPAAVIVFSLNEGAYCAETIRAALESVPKGQLEAGQCVGLTYLQTIFRIVLPLSGPILAVMVLFYGVAQWNSWFPALLYISDRGLYPLQMVLREVLIQSDISNMAGSSGDVEIIGDGLKYATMVVATLPIMCLYPFLQKYFVKGVMIGAVKG